MDSAGTTVYGTYPAATSQSKSARGVGERKPRKSRRRKTYRSCAKEEEEEEDDDDDNNDDDDEGDGGKANGDDDEAATEAERVLEEGERNVQEKEVASNFDTSLLDDDVGGEGGGENNSGEEDEKKKKKGEEGRKSPGKRESDSSSSQGRVKKRAFGCSKCSSRFYSQVSYVPTQDDVAEHQHVTIFVPQHDFFFQEGLTAHERVHDGKKPFSCPVCDLAISSKSTLKIHMRTHSGERPFSCGECDKTFRDGSSLRRHAATHDNGSGGAGGGSSSSSSALECAVCRRRYADRSTFVRHRREKHPYLQDGEEERLTEKEREETAKKYGCNICKKAFKRKITMATHVTRYA